VTISDLDSARASAAAAHREFQAEGVYLNTASLGLPPRAVLRALHEVLEGWQRGEATLRTATCR
jgi:kynureninase